MAIDRPRLLADIVALQSRLTGGYVGVDGAGLLVADAAGPRALRLDMIRLDGNRVAFRDPQSGAFLRAGVGQETFLSIASPHVRGWETFEMVQSGPDVTIRAVQNGLFVGTDGAARLTARWGTDGQGQTFRLIPLSAAASPAASPAAIPALPAQQAAPESRPVQQDLSFAGRWVLDDLMTPGFNDRLMRQVTLSIGARGALDGSAGCNRYGGELREWRSAFRVEQLLITRVGCQGMRGQIERAFIDALTDAAHFYRDGNHLEIRDWNGVLRVRLTRR